jgi:signal transduction histidine kinase
MVRGGLVTVLIGLLIAGLVAGALGLPASDAVVLLAIAVGGALAVGAVGLALARRMHAPPLGRQVLVVVLIGFGATLLGAVIAAQAMFVSSHDLKALSVILVGAATVAVIGAQQVASDVDRASRSLGDITRRIGGGASTPALMPRNAPEELNRLGHELQVMQQRLAEAKLREQRIEQSRRELIAWVSHDLRTPLAGVRAMVEALNDGVVEDDETVHRYLRAIQSEADRLAGLVDDLFELSRIEADTLRLSPEPIAVAELVSDALVSAQAVAARRGVALCGRDGGLPDVASVSIPEMNRVLRNLVDNAIRHTPAGGTVTVEVVGRPAAVEVSVSDECGSIADADLDRVFELAYRADPARAPGEGGGLGLAIAKGIVEAHHGTITVTNRDLGCRFVVELPRVDGGRLRRRGTHDLADVGRVEELDR